MKHYYRIGKENIGLWYSQTGEFTGSIHKDFNWLSASNLEMPFEKELVGYISVADSLEHLYQWFSIQEIKQLQEQGFFIEEWASNDVKFYEHYKHNVIEQSKSILINKILIK